MERTKTSQAIDLSQLLPGARTTARAADVPTAPHISPVEFGDTTIFRSPLIKLDPAIAERERILPPGASGPMGSAYKMLRTQVTQRMNRMHSNTLAILSPAAGAGKTLTAINLSIAIAAETGRHALLIDFDFRNPSIAKRLGFTPEIGAEDCLQSRRPIQDAMIKIEGHDRLTVLPARTRVEQSSELLMSQRTAEIVNEMRTRYANRVLIFDLPPVLQSDDVLAFAPLVQTGLVVVGEGKSRREEVTRTIELLRDLTIVGTVLNGSREKVDAYY